MSVWRIPFIDVAKEIRPRKQELLKAIERVLESGTYIGGKEVRRFEEAFARFCAVRHCVGVNSGTDALILSLQALQIPRGAEVIVPSLTFPATPLAVVAAGCIPVFAEVDSTLTLDVQDVRRCLSRKTKAVIAVHWAGLMANMKSLSELCERHGIALLEDAAQAHGASYHGHPAGSLGIVGCFSFFPTKTLASMGDGGAVTTDRSEIANRVRLLGDFGRTAREKFELLGRNSRLDALHASTLLIQLRHLRRRNKERMKNCERYSLELKDWVGTPVIPPRQTHVYHFYIVRVRQRDMVMAALRRSGVESTTHYSVPCHRQPALASFCRRELPQTGRLCKEILSLPVEITAAQQAVVIREIKSVLKRIGGKGQP